MKKLFLMFAAVVFVGDMARAESFEMSRPFYMRYSRVADYNGNANGAREPLRRAVADLAGSTTAEVTQAWTYREGTGEGQTTCGEVRVNGHVQKFVLQQTRTFVPGRPDITHAHYANVNAADYQFANAGCEREGATALIPPRW